MTDDLSDLGLPPLPAAVSNLVPEGDQPNDGSVAISGVADTVTFERMASGWGPEVLLVNVVVIVALVATALLLVAGDVHAWVMVLALLGSFIVVCVYLAARTLVRISAMQSRAVATGMPLSEVDTTG